MAGKTSLLGLWKPEKTGEIIEGLNQFNSNMDVLDAGMAKAYRGKAVHSVLDNGDFCNPVNQRGLTSYTGTGGKVYTIDRWYTWSPYISVALQDGYVSISNSSDNEYQQLTQSITSHKMTGKAVTLAVWDAEGGVHCASGTLVQGTTIAYVDSSVFWMSVSLDANGDIAVSLYPRVGQTVQIKHVALYPGAYTADTLPEYQPPKNEMTECQLYYLPLNHQLLGSGYTFTGGATLLVPRKMRIDAPSFVASGTILARVNGADYPLTLSSVATSGTMIKVDFACGNIPVNYPCAFYADAYGVSLNADL